MLDDLKVYFAVVFQTAWLFISDHVIALFVGLSSVFMVDILTPQFEHSLDFWIKIAGYVLGLAITWAFIVVKMRKTASEKRKIEAEEEILRIQLINERKMSELARETFDRMSLEEHLSRITELKKTLPKEQYEQAIQPYKDALESGK